jgi:hypothetical protein
VFCEEPSLLGSEKNNRHSDGAGARVGCSHCIGDVLGLGSIVVGRGGEDQPQPRAAARD